MTTTTVAEPPVRPAARSLHTRRVLGLAGLLVALAVVALLSITLGARSIPLGHVWTLLWHPDDTDASVVVHAVRIPRTILGLLVGGALGISGALMQALTRNPLAEPGLLGVSAGASAAVVTATVAVGETGPLTYVWFSMVGAGVASVVVYGVASAGRSGANPVRLALAGTAVSFALIAYVKAMVLLDTRALDEFRFWQLGSLGGHPSSLNIRIAPFVVVGALLACALGRSLNVVGLGDEHARSLGTSPGRVRALGAIAITLLCGAATAAAGPIVFVGLAVPHIARAVCGPDQRWVIPYSGLLAPVLLLGADVIGRVVERPGELEVGVVSAVLGAPAFIAIVRRRQIAQL